MKYFLAFAAVAGLIIGGVVLYANLNKDDDYFPIALVMGPQANGEVPLHVVVAMGMYRTDPPRPGTGMANDLDWIEKHFNLRDSAGNRVLFTKGGHSALITEQQASNPEFYMVAKLKPGENYTLEYLEIPGSDRVFRHSFNAAASGTPFVRANFQRRHK